MKHAFPRVSIEFQFLKRVQNGNTILYEVSILLSCPSMVLDMSITENKRRLEEQKIQVINQEKPELKVIEEIIMAVEENPKEL